MKKNLLLFVLLSALGGFNLSFGQQPELDSLRLELTNAKHDTSRIRLRYHIGEKARIFRITYWDSLRIDADKWKMKEYEADALNNIGFIYKNQGDIPKALEYYGRGLKMYEGIGNKEGTALSLYNIGSIYYVQGDIPKALEYYGSGLKMYEEIGNKEGIALSLNNFGLIYKNQGDIPKALEYYKRSLAIMEEIGNKRYVSNNLNNIGSIYYAQGDIPKALEYHNRSLKIRDEIGDKNGIATSLNSIGLIYKDQGDIPKALEYLGRSLKMLEEIGNRQSIALSLNNIGGIHLKQKDYPSAEAYLKRSMDLSAELGYPENIRATAQNLSELYKTTGKHELALENYELYITMRDSINNIETQKATIKQQTKYEYEKRELTIAAEQEKKDAIAIKELQRQKLVRNVFIGGFAFMFLFAGVFFVQRNRIGKEKERSEELLLNILPSEVAAELKQKGYADAKQFDEVTVLFTDFKGFTAMAEQMSAKELVDDLNVCFSEFDRIMGKYGIEKIKTIGDAYMAAGGLPSTNTTHATDVVKAALEMAKVVERGKTKKIAENLPFFEIRIGIHTGPVVAGIVGVKKFQYDIWGDTVNTASRMESSGEVGKVNISESTYALLKDDARFSFISRGKIQAKGKGEMEMFFVSEI